MEDGGRRERTRDMRGMTTAVGFEDGGGGREPGHEADLGAERDKETGFSGASKSP